MLPTNLKLVRVTWTRTIVREGVSASGCLASPLVSLRSLWVDLPLVLVALLYVLALIDPTVNYLHCNDIFCL